MSFIALIPVRGNSKGLPRKNLLLLAGKPLIVHTIEHALAARHVGGVFVTTESDEIAAVSKAAGAEVISRPLELASDTASSESALLHALAYLEAAGESLPEAVVFLQCTSPLRQPNDIDQAIDTFCGEAADSLFSGCRHHVFLWRRRRQGWEPLNYDMAHRPRRQDQSSEVLENGSIYITKTALLRETGNRLGGKISVYEMSPTDSLQVDTEEDFRLIEQVMVLRRRDTE